jgi:hypothetical protein
VHILSNISVSTETTEIPTYRGTKQEPFEDS